MRNQGPKYMVRQARLFTSAINLTEMANFWNQKRYVSYLDDLTIKLMAFFPKGARRNFGAARKALNLFFRDILYNSRLVQHYELNTSIHYLSQLEIPLDNQTAKKIIEAVYSVRQPGWFLHACNDHSDINLKTVEFLRRFEGFRFHAVIGRKIPEIFIRKHNGNATEFYFDLIHKLLALHPLTEDTSYHLFLSQRQSNTEQRFKQAFEKVLTAERKDGKTTYTCNVVRSSNFPELSVVDYLLWTLQRYILKGEKRYFAALQHHYEQILDIYENDGQGNLYTQEDRFELEKASPFTIGAKK